jgi:hypothetical protein
MSVKKLKFKIEDIIKFPDLDNDGRPYILEAADRLIHIQSKIPLASPGTLFTTIRKYHYRYMQASKDVLYAMPCDMVNDTTIEPSAHNPGERFVYNYISLCDIKAGNYGLMWQIEPISQAIGSGGYGTTIIMDPNAIPEVTIYFYITHMTSYNIPYEGDPDDPETISTGLKIFNIEDDLSKLTDRFDHAAADTLLTYAPVDKKRKDDPDPDNNPTILEYINDQFAIGEGEIQTLEKQVNDLTGEIIPMSPLTTDLNIKDYVDLNEMGFCGENLQMYENQNTTIEEYAFNYDRAVQQQFNDTIEMIHGEETELQKSMVKYADSVGTSVLALCSAAIEGLPTKRYEFFSMGKEACRDPMSMAFNALGSCYTTEVCLDGTYYNNQIWMHRLYHKHFAQAELQGLWARIGLTYDFNTALEIPAVTFSNIAESSKNLVCTLNRSAYTFNKNNNPTRATVNFTVTMGNEANSTFTYEVGDPAQESSQKDYVMELIVDNHGHRQAPVFAIFNYGAARDYLGVDELGGYMYARFIFDHIWYRQIVDYINTGN